MGGFQEPAATERASPGKPPGHFSAGGKGGGAHRGHSSDLHRPLGGRGGRGTQRPLGILRGRRPRHESALTERGGPLTPLSLCRRPPPLRPANRAESEERFRRHGAVRGRRSTSQALQRRRTAAIKERRVVPPFRWELKRPRAPGPGHREHTGAQRHHCAHGGDRKRRTKSGRTDRRKRSKREGG